MLFHILNASGRSALLITCVLVLIDTVVNTVMPIQRKIVVIAYAESHFYSHMRNYSIRTDLKLGLLSSFVCTNSKCSGETYTAWMHRPPVLLLVEYAVIAETRFN